LQGPVHNLSYRARGKRSGGCGALGESTEYCSLSMATPFLRPPFRNALVQCPNDPRASFTHLPHAHRDTSNVLPSSDSRWHGWLGAPCSGHSRCLPLVVACFRPPARAPMLLICSPGLRLPNLFTTPYPKVSETSLSWQSNHGGHHHPSSNSSRKLPVLRGGMPAQATFPSPGFFGQAQRLSVSSAPLL